MKSSVFVYDIEIANLIPTRNVPNEKGLSYCKGWEDHAGMGIACIGVYDYHEDDYLVFDDTNLDKFGELVSEREIAVSFNGLNFDDKVLAANDVKITCESYDLLVELWASVGLSSTFNFKTHGGFSLDAVLETNFGIGKSGSGADAPRWWQEGKRADVINYCLRDVKLTKMLFDRVARGSMIKNPKNSSELLSLRAPFELKSVSMSATEASI